MKVKIEGFGQFKKQMSIKNPEIEVEDGLSGEQLLEVIGITLDEVGFITVNDQKVNMDIKLTDGQKIGIYPYIIGG